ncbi:MAG: type II 3-dehydroquinate dehydratase [Alphaproteobacteria bacterium]|nr:type II 3-dehydroquinate dehydratase [Alphaproteobacteria bacterium]
MSLPIYCLNGPNLNLLGAREPHIYGNGTLEDLKKLSEEVADALGATVDFRQSNHEGDLVDWVQEANTKAAAVVVNAGGYTHTSVALHDALKTLTIPVVEVHLSNPGNREEFRRQSLVSLTASGMVAGFGAYGYSLAVQAAAHLAKQRRA